MASTITLQRSINVAQQYNRLAPLTFTSLFSLAVNFGGTGYLVGDVISVLGTGNGGTAMVSTIGGGGVVTGLIVLVNGSKYINGATAVPTSGGTGTGLTVNTFTSSDPAFSNADWVRQIMLSPPFAWRWNRSTGYSPGTPTFVTIIGKSDYTVNLPNFGWLEKAVGYDPADGYRTFELQVQLVKGADAIVNEPTRIAAQNDDGAGNITFRVFPAPDKSYNIVLEYQLAAPLFTSLTNTWAPIPDYLAYVYNEGFQAKAYEYANDPRFPAAMQLFMQNLAANAEGLEESQKNIWLEDRLNSIRQTQVVQSGRG